MSTREYPCTVLAPMWCSPAPRTLRIVRRPRRGPQRLCGARSQRQRFIALFGNESMISRAAGVVPLRFNLHLPRPRSQPDLSSGVRHTVRHGSMSRDSSIVAWHSAPRTVVRRIQRTRRARERTDKGERISLQEPAIGRLNRTRQVGPRHGYRARLYRGAWRYVS